MTIKYARTTDGHGFSQRSKAATKQFTAKSQRTQNLKKKTHHGKHGVTPKENRDYRQNRCTYGSVDFVSPLLFISSAILVALRLLRKTLLKKQDFARL